MDLELAAFIRNPVDGDLITVPGVNEENKTILMERGILNTFQLMGQFLMFCGKEIDPYQISERFQAWLQKVGIRDNLDLIVSSVSEKIGSWIPGTYCKDFVIL
jgi:hypothetical protein